MQRKKLLYLAASVILFITIFSGCDKSADTVNEVIVYGSGKIVSETITAEECNGLKIINIGDIYIKQDTIQSIRVEADDNIINKVIVSEEKGILLTGLKDGSYSNITLKVYVSLKDICSLSIEGAGRIIAENDIRCDSMFCNIYGAGNINIKGMSNYFNCSINGAGEISAKDFNTKKCISLVNGTGSITINVIENLDATVIGAGTIIYYGNPLVVTTSITGIGHIIHK